MEALAQQQTDLVAAAQAGGRDAFSALVRQHQRSVFFTALRIGRGDEQFARDLTQRAFMQAWAKRAEFRGEAAFKTWLLRITTNLSLNEQRRAWRHREVVPEPVDPSSPAELGEVAPEAFDRLENKRARALLRDAVDDLPDRQRHVALLRLYEDLSFAEVGAACGISANNAKVSFHHAVRNIRKNLEAKGVAS